MNLFKRLFSGSQQKVDRDKLVPLLNAIIRPLEYSAVERINSALRHIEDPNSQGRFMLLLMHVCLASILQRIDSGNGRRTGLSTAFKDFAISQWHRPRGVTIDSDQKLFAYTQQELGDKLLSPDEAQLVDVGLTLLSMALPGQEEFTTGAALVCGQAALTCWRQAAVEADKAMGKPPEMNAATAKIDELVYLMNYRDHYADILGAHVTDRRLAELFLFRGWTAQFGYRMFSTNPEASEKLIGETVNASKYLGLGIFREVHGFSVESELGSDFLTLIEDRWYDYDHVIVTTPKAGIQTMEIVSVLTKRLDVSDPVVTYRLSIDFLSQLDVIKRTAIEIGLLQV